MEKMRNAIWSRLRPMPMRDHFSGWSYIVHIFWGGGRRGRGGGARKVRHNQYLLIIHIVSHQGSMGLGLRALYGELLGAVGVGKDLGI